MAYPDAAPTPLLSPLLLALFSLITLCRSTLIGHISRMNSTTRMYLIAQLRLAL